MRRVLMLTALVFSGCGEPPQAPPGPTLATIVVTSPVDSMLAVGKTTQLAAQARDAAGGTLANVTLAWTSSNAAAFTVTSTGAVTAVAPGNATVSAAASGITGIVRLRATAADLTTLGSLSNDAYTTSLINAVTTAKRTAVQTAFAKCASGVASGGIVSIQQCGSGVAAEAVSAADPSDKTLISILQLFSDEAQRRLGL